MADPQVLHEVLADNPLLVTAEEAAILLSVSRTTVYTLIKAGALRPVHIGRSCRLSRAELLRYVDRLETPHEAEAH
jgi:excisionase family DNA binding protein